MSKEKMVCVEWEDAVWNNGYYDKKSPEDFTTVKSKSVGHMVKKTSQSIILSSDRFYLDNGRLESERHINIIPKKMIKRIIYLTEV